jgi:hypothetical protein
MVYWTYSIVKSGETTAPYCAVFALLERVPFVLGEMVSVQMPHQHRTLEGGGRKSFFDAVQHSSDENALAKVGRMAGPFP